MDRLLAFEGREPLDRTLVRRASELVIGGDIDEVLLVEAPIGQAVRRERLWHERRDADLFSLQDLLALEVASVGNDRKLFDARSLSGMLGHLCQLVAI